MGCATRDRILRRDLTAKTYVAGSTCRGRVQSGTLYDPYTGDIIMYVRANGSNVDIDHVVALLDAWQKGAQQWSAAKRRMFANDPLDLLAVGAAVNRAKGDSDAATWLPPRKSFRCDFIARQITVKVKYGLWVTTAEGDAMARVLAACPDQRLTSESTTTGPTTTSESTTTSPTTTTSEPTTTSRTTTATNTSPSGRVVHPGAFCSAEGARGVTSKGVPMVCTTSPTDSRLRWRKS
jgi:hypothetical protein